MLARRTPGERGYSTIHHQVPHPWKFGITAALYFRTPKHHIKANQLTSLSNSRTSSQRSLSVFTINFYEVLPRLLCCCCNLYRPFNGGQRRYFSVSGRRNPGWSRRGTCSMFPHLTHVPVVYAKYRVTKSSLLRTTAGSSITPSLANQRHVTTASSVERTLHVTMASAYPCLLFVF